MSNKKYRPKIGQDKYGRPDPAKHTVEQCPDCQPSEKELLRIHEILANTPGPELVRTIDRLTEELKAVKKDNVILYDAQKDLQGEIERLKELVQEGVDAWHNDSGWEMFHRWAVKASEAPKEGEE